MRIILKLLFCLLAAALIAACSSSQINQKGFAKVQPGMSMQQVQAILGKPTRVDSIDIDGLSGTSATWKTKDAVIVIQFLNDSVKIKTFTNINDRSLSSTT